MKYLIPIFVITILLVPMVVYAQGDVRDRPAVQRLLSLLDDIELFLFVLAAGIGLIVIIVSGIMYITSGGDEGKTTTAKKTLTYGLIGVAIALCSGFILNLLEDVLARIAY